MSGHRLLRPKLKDQQLVDPLTGALLGDPAGAAAAAIVAHAALADPHPGYVTTAEGAALISAHEIAANPHPTYLTAAEGDAAYVAKGSGGTYVVTNATEDRAYDANATTLDEVADTLGTLIADLRAKGIVQ